MKTKTRVTTLALIFLIVVDAFSCREREDEDEAIPTSTEGWQASIKRSIARIDLMPNNPAPYLMRDWRQVTIDYDEFVFNFNVMGQFLPLGWWDTEHVNLPSNSFGIQSYVSDAFIGGSGEAINCIAAVVSATLVGIDKSNQRGNNFVYMCQNWYNPNEKMIMNNPTETNPCDFWYVLLPNILFSQLVYYYPREANMSTIMYNAANMWFLATDVMRNSGFAYQSFDFNKMVPHIGTHKEPDAAAGIAWIEYMAYTKFKEIKFLNAADWCLDWLTTLNYNPLYEILLPYGAYIAARMNAELGRTYDLPKIINWCFGPGSPEAREGWGVIAQNWGGYDCHGLHGSITDGDGYAFAMGTFENVGCLVPLVRYDDRYARAIGKYVLNAANAARLYYGNALDDSHQDSEDWIKKYDKDYCIAYEGLRKNWNNISPLATGDANRDRYLNQSRSTNLGLYGSSHVGIFGGIIQTTNVEKILQLNCLVTDYFHDAAYPTYLYYNPYNTAKTIEINVGQNPKDIYDTTTNDFLATNISGVASFTLPSNSAAVIVVTPANGTVLHDNNKTLINGVVVDYIP